MHMSLRDIKVLNANIDAVYASLRLIEHRLNKYSGLSITAELYAAMCNISNTTADFSALLKKERERYIGRSKSERHRIKVAERKRRLMATPLDEATLDANNEEVLSKLRVPPDAIESMNILEALGTLNEGDDNNG